MQRTTSDAPVRASPARNTPSASGVCSGRKKPMASSTRSASMISLRPVGRIVGRPPSAAGCHSTSSTSTPVTLPSGEPRKRLEARHQRRVQPSSWLEVVLNTCGHCGHGVAGLLPTGGLGIISICVTLAAPWRLAVPMQSLPVSPPPITSTRLPLAVTRCSSENVWPASTRFCCAKSSSAK